MPRKQKQYHFIYKTTCLITNKYYIGMHSTNNLNDGYLGSGKRLKYSINKYGKKNHNRKIIEYLESREKLKDREFEIITEDLLNDFYCMNLTYGGNGNWDYLNKNSNIQRAKGLKGNIKMKWLRENDLNWKKTNYKNLSNGQLKTYKNGRIPNTPNWLGMTHSEETKKKIGFANSISQKGNKNSQYGTCWITNGKESKKINKGDLVPNGWRLGRKIIKW